MRYKSRNLLSALMLMSLGAVNAHAACQVTPEHLISYPGQSVQVEIECDGGEAFDTVKWTATPEGGAVADLTGVLAVPRVTNDRILFALPLAQLGNESAVAKTYLINFVGTLLSSGSISSTKSARLIVNPAEKVALTVAKTGAGTGTVTSGPVGISCGADCTENYALNTQVMLNATPGASSVFSGWTGDCVGTGGCQVTLATAKAVTANFGAVVNGACGSADSTPTATAPTANLCSDSSTPAVTPSQSEYSWSCAGTPGLGSTASCSAARKYTVTVEVGANGTLNPAVAQQVAYNGAQSFTINPTATYSATLDPTSTCGGTIAAGGLSYQTAAITGNCLVKVNFTNAPTCGSANTVATVIAPSNGSLCSVGTGSSVTSGTSSFTWSCTATGQPTATCSAPKSFNVTVGTISGGSISPNTPQVVPYGQTKQFILTPTTVGHTLTLGGTCGNLSATNNGNGTFTYNTAAIGNSCEVTASFSDLLGGCSAPASNVVVIPTNLPTSSSYGRVDFSSVAPEKVYSFQMRSKAGATAMSGTTITTKMTSGIAGKRVVLSSCPGETTPVMAKCSKFAAESARLDYYTNLASTSYCVVQPDTVYYLNVFNKTNVTDTTYNCGSATSPATASTQCAFSFTAN